MNERLFFSLAYVYYYNEKQHFNEHTMSNGYHCTVNIRFYGHLTVKLGSKLLYQYILGNASDTSS